MKNILNLNIGLKDDCLKNTLEIISEELTKYNEWTMSLHEESVENLIAFNYKKDEQNISIYCIENNNQLEVVNVLSVGESNFLPISECNEMLIKFEKDILNATSLKYSIHN